MCADTETFCSCSCLFFSLTFCPFLKSQEIQSLNCWHGDEDAYLSVHMDAKADTWSAVWFTLQTSYHAGEHMGRNNLIASCSNLEKWLELDLFTQILWICLWETPGTKQQRHFCHNCLKTISGCWNRFLDIYGFCIPPGISHLWNKLMKRTERREMETFLLVKEQLRWERQDNPLQICSNGTQRCLGPNSRDGGDGGISF